MAKPKMQYFEISNGVRRDIDEETLTYSKFGSYVSTNYGKDVDTDLTLPVDPNEYAFLKTNPFLITWNRSNENYKSYTFDEFIIRYKNQDYRMGEFINSKKIRYGTKKRVLKSVFKKWEEEFNNKKDSSIEKINTNLDIAKDVYYEKKPFGRFIIMFILALVVAIMLVLPQIVFANLDILFKTDIFLKFSDTLKAMYDAEIIVLITGIIALLFPVTYMIGHVVYNTQCANATRFVFDYKEWLRDNNSKISRKFKKNFKTVRNYYLKHMNRKGLPFPPFRLKNIEVKTSVDQIDRLNVLTIDKIHHYKSVVKSGNGFTNLMYVFSFMIIVIYCLLIIYNVIL